MTIIRRPTPLGELISLRNTMDRLFDDTFGRPRSGWLRLSIPTADAAKPRQVEISPVGEAQVGPTAELATEPGTEQDR